MGVTIVRAFAPSPRRQPIKDIIRRLQSCYVDRSIFSPGLIWTYQNIYVRGGFMKNFVTLIKYEGAVFPLSSTPLPCHKTGNTSTQKAYHERALVLAQARNSFAERGYERFNMRDLAGQCGISVQSLYNNLGGREEILTAAITELLKTQIARLKEECARNGHNFILFFCEFIACRMELDCKYAKAITATLKTANNKPRLASAFEEILVGAYRSCLLDMQKQGSLKDWCDIDSIAVGLQSTIATVLTEHSNRRLSIDGLRNQLMMNAGLTLLGASNGNEARRIEATMDALFKNGRSNLMQIAA